MLVAGSANVGAGSRGTRRRTPADRCFVFRTTVGAGSGAAGAAGDVLLASGFGAAGATGGAADRLASVGFDGRLDQSAREEAVPAATSDSPAATASGTGASRRAALLLVAGNAGLAITSIVGRINGSAGVACASARRAHSTVSNASVPGGA
jgi:hypothetical protein